MSVALLIGLVLFGLSLLPRTPEGSYDGYPLTVNHPTFPCGAPNPLNGCAFVYDPYTVLLDFFFWVVVGFVPATLLAFFFVGRPMSRRTKALVGITVVAVAALSIFFLVPTQPVIKGECLGEYLTGPQAQSLSFPILGVGMVSSAGHWYWQWQPLPLCF